MHAGPNTLREHIDAVTNTMRDHRDAMIEALERELPDARTYRAGGGYFLWVELPPHVCAEALARRAIGHGVEVTPGRLCFPEDDPGHFLRLSFSLADPDDIKEGIRRLGAAYREIS